MNAIDFYYLNQAKARGIDTPEAAILLAPTIDRIYNALILQQLPANKDASIYEVACGPGLVLSWLKRRGFTNTKGTDISEDYVRIARQSGQSAEVRDSLADLKNQADNSLDVVFAIDFIEHLPKDVFLEFILVVKRVLRPGGLLILRCPNADSPIVGRNLYNDITHFWAYTTVSLRAIAQVIGFSSVVFVDEASSPPPDHLRWTMPISWLCRKFLRLVWALATRERIDYWSPNLFVIIRR